MLVPRTEPDRLTPGACLAPSPLCALEYAASVSPHDKLRITGLSQCVFPSCQQYGTPGGHVTTQAAVYIPRVSKAVGLAWGLRICISTRS